ncbi:MAG: ABC transporter ATP-binding protein [Acidimicrobiia bacterium]
MSVVIENLSVAYGANLALERISLVIEERERFAVMGASGSGKSSLLRAIAGIIPSTGTITADGVRLDLLPPHERPIGLMFQNYALFPHMTVLDNVAYGLRMAGIPSAARNTRASELLDLVGLGGFGPRDPNTLSGGEQQRVALARTLAPEPTILMLDEPLGSLDLTLRESLLHEMRTIVTAVGATAIYVTHDRGEAFAFADRVAILDTGRVAAVASPAVLWRAPGTERVARLIGHPNILSTFRGRGPVSIPSDAITIDTDGALRATVVESMFSDGAFATSVVTEDGSELALTTRHPLEPGTVVGITIDDSEIIDLAP